MPEPQENKPSSALLFTRDPRMWGLRAAMFLILMSCGIVWVYAGIRMKDCGLGETFIGVLLGVGGALSACVGLFWGWLSDRTGKSTPIVAAGCLLIGGSLGILWVSRQPAQFVTYQIVVSCGMSATSTVMPLLALSLIGSEAPGAGYGRFRVFGSVGYMVALYGLASALDGLDRLFHVAAACAVAAVVPLLWANVRPQRHAHRHGFAGLLRHPPLAWFLLAVFLLSLGSPSVFTFLAIYARGLGLGQAQVGRLLGVLGVAALVGLPIMGTVADRIGGERVLLLGFLAMPARILIQAAADGPLGLYAAQCLHCLTWAGPEVVAYTYVTRLAGEQDRGVAVSALITTRTLGHLVGAPLTGYLAENAGYGRMFVTMAALSSLGFFVFLVERRCSRSRQPCPLAAG